MFRLTDWKFCRKFNCSEGAPLPGLRNSLSARQWLQQFLGDWVRLSAIRALLAEEITARDFSRRSDQAILAEMAELLASGRVHVHALPLEPFAGPKSEFQRPSAQTKPAEKFSVSPSTPRPRPAPREAPVDPPSFSALVNQAAQAAVLKAAAASGKPFCPE